jgi:integrase/recombinase XerD
MRLKTPSGTYSVNVSIYLREDHGGYVAYVRWFINKDRRQLTIPLKTYDDDLAKRRTATIKTVENIRDIIGRRIVNDNKKHKFPWLNKNADTKLIPLDTLGKLKEKFLRDKSGKIDQSSVDRYGISLDRFIDVLGKNFRIKNIKKKHINDFKEAYEGKHKPSGININLRGIKCFLRWVAAEDDTPDIKVPKIDMEDEPPLSEKVIPDSVMAELMRSNLREIYKYALSFGYSTGCRIDEMLRGRLLDDFLYIESQYTKSGKEREIYLNNTQKDYWIKVYNDFKNNHSCTETSYEGYIQHELREVCLDLIKQKKIDQTYTFHCLRHTYITRRCIQLGGNLYLVKEEVGHSSVNTTELYKDFKQSKLLSWFPSLEKEIKALFKKEMPSLVTVNPVTVEQAVDGETADS